MREGDGWNKGCSGSDSVRSAKAFLRFEAAPRAILCDAQRHSGVSLLLRELFCAMRKSIFAFRGRSCAMRKGIFALRGRSESLAANLHGCPKS